MDFLEFLWILFFITTFIFSNFLKEQIVYFSFNVRYFAANCAIDSSSLESSVSSIISGWLSSESRSESQINPEMSEPLELSIDLGESAPMAISASMSSNSIPAISSSFPCGSFAMKLSEFRPG